jgi:predicted dinucleotide-binding enzyme
LDIAPSLYFALDKFVLVKPKVGIIGAGNVGNALKKGLETASYEVRAVGKDPKGVSEIARWAEIIVLAVPFSALNETLSEVGNSADGKIVIDVTNAYTPEAIASLGSTSGAEVLQKKLPRAKIVKTLNMHFAKNMETGHCAGERLTCFSAGDDRSAKEKVLELTRDLGFDAVDAGPLANAKLLESLGILNIQLGFNLGLGTDIGFKLVRA